MQTLSLFKVLCPYVYNQMCQLPYSELNGMELNYLVYIKSGRDVTFKKKLKRVISATFDNYFMSTFL